MAEQIHNAEEVRNSALKYAFKIISISPKTERQIFKKLEEKSFSPEIINDIIKTLKNQGYVNDEKYAAEWIEGKNRRHPIGKILAEKELREKGIEDSIIKKTLDEKMPLSKERELAESIAAEKMKKENRKTRGAGKRKILAKISFFLSGRGFDCDIISNILEKISNKP